MPALSLGVFLKNLWSKSSTPSMKLPYHFLLVSFSRNTVSKENLSSETSRCCDFPDARRFQNSGTEDAPATLIDMPMTATSFVFTRSKGVVASSKYVIRPAKLLPRLDGMQRSPKDTKDVELSMYDAFRSDMMLNHSHFCSRIARSATL